MLQATECFSSMYSFLNDERDGAIFIGFLWYVCLIKLNITCHVHTNHITFRQTHTFHLPQINLNMWHYIGLLGIKVSPDVP